MEKYKTKIETRQHLTEETGQRYKNIGTHKTTLENKVSYHTHIVYICWDGTRQLNDWK